jgi:hypothetical protein
LQTREVNRGIAIGRSVFAHKRFDPDDFLSIGRNACQFESMCGIECVNDGIKRRNRLYLLGDFGARMSILLWANFLLRK